MDHTDHTNLLRNGVTASGGVWADFGAGAGAFTLALAELIGPEGEIHCIDQDAHALQANERAMRARFTETSVQYRVADFTLPLQLPPLHGIVIANALHFQQEQAAVVQLLGSYLRPAGRLIIVEYNVERGNFAVPYAVPYQRWETLAREAGFAHTELLARRPSRFLREIYSAASW